MKTNFTIGIASVVVVAAVVAVPVVHFSTMDTVVGVEILDKERVVTKDDSFYMIYTDRETFKNVDSLLSLKFNSSDYYGKINRGQTCTFKVNGVRVPFMSMYRNILDFHCTMGTDNE